MVLRTSHHVVLQSLMARGAAQEEAVKAMVDELEAGAQRCAH